MGKSCCNDAKMHRILNLENSRTTGWAGKVDKPTLRTIAQATGLAVTTVSRALAGDPRIAARTRSAVAEVAERLGYVPDRAAQRLRTGRSKVVALLLNTGHEYLGFTHELIAGLMSALNGTGYSVAMLPDLIDEGRATAVREVLRNRMADGIVFSRTEVFDDRVRLLSEHGFPFVSHGRTEFAIPHAFVDYDNEAFARAAARHLVGRGRERLLMIAPQGRFTFGQHLRYGLTAEARAAGAAVEIPEDIHLDRPPEEIAAWLRRRLVRPDRPDAIICVGEVPAIAANAALGDLGLQAGRDVDLVAKRASPVFEMLRANVFTAFEDLRETGRLIGETLLRRIAGEPPETLGILQPPLIEFAPEREAVRRSG
jgi:LacI family transcriptional regulator